MCQVLLTNLYGRDLIRIQCVNERMVVPRNLGQTWSHITTAPFCLQVGTPIKHQLSVAKGHITFEPALDHESEL